MYDIVGDIHAHGSRLERLLERRATSRTLKAGAIPAASSSSLTASSTAGCGRNHLLVGTNNS